MTTQIQEKVCLLGSYRSVSSLDDDDTISDIHTMEPQLSYCSVYSVTIILALLSSLLLNAVLLVRRYDAQNKNVSISGTTRYARLDYSTNGTWELESAYTQENLTAADEEWLKLDIDYAFVSLTKEDSNAMGLPSSLAFPWDTKKSLYLLSSVHSIHCLQVLHRSNLEYRTNHTQTYTTEHLLHCLDNLRTDLMCSADDTPRYVPTDATRSTVKTGVGQIRQCRDWNRLESWAKNHSACFNYNEFERKELEEDRVYPAAWSYCAKDSQYLSSVQRFYGQSPHWVPADRGRPEIDKIRAKIGE